MPLSDEYLWDRILFFNIILRRKDVYQLFVLLIISELFFIIRKAHIQLSLLFIFSVQELGARQIFL